MAAERITFDTNILFYALDSDAGEKHDIAANLLDRALDAEPVLLLQSLAELFNATRKRQEIPFDEVREFIANNMNVLPVIAFGAPDLLPAIALQQAHKLQFWDALLITTAIRAGCTLLLSEDGQHGRAFDGLTIINPFRLSASERGRFFLPAE